MAEIETECPRCEAHQRFVLHKAMIDQQKSIVEVYIKCKRCPYKSVLRTTTIEIEKLREYKFNIMARIADLMRTHEAIPSALFASLEKIDLRINQAKINLQKDLNEAN